MAGEVRVGDETGEGDQGAERGHGRTAEEQGRLGRTEGGEAAVVGGSREGERGVARIEGESWA